MFFRLLLKSLLFSAAFLSCSFFQMAPLRIVSVSPENTLTEVISEFKVSVTFSAACNKTLTENAFSLLEGGNDLEGVFSWNDNYDQLSFIPYTPFDQYSIYEISIDTTAEDKYGNSLDEELHHKFSMKTDDTMPRVVSCSPEEFYITDDLRQSITIGFSKPIRPKSWLQSFSIRPSIKGIHSWNEEKTIFTFAPVEDLEKQETYTITVDSSCCDLFGLSIGESYSINFSTITDKTSPALSSIYDKETQAKIMEPITAENNLLINTGWECDDDLILTFSKPVKTENIKSFIEFDPPVSFDIEDQSTDYLQKINLIFDNRLTWDTVYQITVTKGFEDASGNFAEEDSIRYFKTDGSNTKPPILFFEDGIVFLSDPEGSSQSDITSLSPDTTFPNTSYAVSDTVITFFDFKIELSNPSDEDEDSEPLIQSFLQNISISATNQSISFSVLGAHLSPPSGITAEGFSDNISPVFTLEPNQRVIRLYLELTNNIAAGIISIELSDGFTDNKGNSISKAYSVQYIKN